MITKFREKKKNMEAQYEILLYSFWKYHGIYRSSLKNSPNETFRDKCISQLFINNKFSMSCIDQHMASLDASLVFASIWYTAITTYHKVQTGHEITEGSMKFTFCIKLYYSVKFHYIHLRERELFNTHQ